jgi:predicted small lipoprotein YifL
MHCKDQMMGVGRALLLLSCVFLSSCGQTGALYLPDEKHPIDAAGKKPVPIVDQAYLNAQPQ